MLAVGIEETVTTTGFDAILVWPFAWQVAV